MKIDDFQINIYVPSHRKHRKFGQLTNKSYKNILKYIETQNEQLLSEYLECLIEHLGGIKVEDLNKIDIFCILLTIRIVCIGPTIELQLTCPKTKKKYKTTLDLNNILQRFTDIGEATEQEFKINDDISLKIGIPKTLLTDETQLIDTMTYCINSICVKNKKYSLEKMSYKKKRNIINSLPGEVFNYIVRYANNIQSKFNDSVILTEKSPHYEDSTAHEHKLGLYNNSMFSFLKLIFGDSLIGYYEMLYSLASNVKIQPQYIESLTPAEASIFLTTRRKELAEQERLQKEQENKNTGPSLPNRFSGLVDNI